MRPGLVLALTLVTACGRTKFNLLDDAGSDAAVADAHVAVTGCADGEREAFVNPSFLDIAGCGATWAGTPSMRDQKTGAPCGDDLGACAVPADACGVGWHLCGDSGDPLDLSSRITAAECAAPGGPTGRFVAALGHCVSCSAGCNNGESECNYGTTYGCVSLNVACAEPVCCGSMCTLAGNCHGGVFAAPDTRIGFPARSCGAMTGDSQTGVMCCAD